MEILRDPHYDFLGKTRILMSLSLVIILTGVIYISQKGVRYGVEFEGGTQLILRFGQAPDIDRVRHAAAVRRGAEWLLSPEVRPLWRSAFPVARTDRLRRLNDVTRYNALRARLIATVLDTIPAASRPISSAAWGGAKPSSSVTPLSV